MITSSSAPPRFYYDLGCPECYLAAERALLHPGAMVAEWEPVLAVELGISCSEPDRAAIEQQARQLGIQPLRWPRLWPPDSREAMLAATYAKQIGRIVAFSLAAFRQAFAGGRDLSDKDTVLIAGAACEMHPAALLKGIGLRSTASALAQATESAQRLGIQKLPAIVA